MDTDNLENLHPSSTCRRMCSSHLFGMREAEEKGLMGTRKVSGVLDPFFNQNMGLDTSLYFSENILWIYTEWVDCSLCNLYLCKLYWKIKKNICSRAWHPFHRCLELNRKILVCEFMNISCGFPRVTKYFLSMNVSGYVSLK